MVRFIGGAAAARYPGGGDFLAMTSADRVPAARRSRRAQGQDGAVARCALVGVLLILLLCLLSNGRPIAPAMAGPRHVAGDPEAIAAAGPQVAEQYTIIAKGEDLDLPTDTPRLAVLIGNGRYDTAPDNANPLKARLPRLQTPCLDVKLIADKLASLGWARNEIYVLCDQSNMDTYSAINSLQSAAPLDGKTPRLMLLYLAGHGMEVDGDNYIFGVSTRLDLETVAKRLAAKEKNPSKSETPEPLLAIRDGVNIDNMFGGYRGQANPP